MATTTARRIIARLTFQIVSLMFMHVATTYMTSVLITGLWNPLKWSVNFLVLVALFSAGPGTLTFFFIVLFFILPSLRADLDEIDREMML